MEDNYYELLRLIRIFLDTLTETQGYVEGEWPEYKALMDVLGWDD